MISKRSAASKSPKRERKSPAKEPLRPAARDYLTDGRYLMQVLGVNRKGEYELEDCSSGMVVIYTPEEFDKCKWKLVQPKAAA